MTTFHRTCLDDHTITGGDTTLKLVEGKRYIVSPTDPNGTITVFSTYWVSGIPSEWFDAGEQFTT